MQASCSWVTLVATRTSQVHEMPCVRQATHTGSESASGCAGSRACFDNAAAYLQGFAVPPALITGNHDLEVAVCVQMQPYTLQFADLYALQGADFDTDEANLAAWQEVCVLCCGPALNVS